MTSQNPQVKCQKCGTSDEDEQLVVWSVADPYYGYGHYSTIRCTLCPANLDDERYDSKHTYDPDYDNQFLGLPYKPIGSYTLYIDSPDILHCFECGKLIDKDGKVGLNERPCWLTRRGWEDLYMCMPCFRLQEGVKLEDIYKNRTKEFEEKMDIYVAKWREVNPKSSTFDIL